MMVVLILVSLITTLMMQGFSFVMGLQERIRAQLVQVKDNELREQWFRLTVRSLHRARPSDNASFTGDNESFSGLTLQPLFEQTGMPTKITWRLVSQNASINLIYEEEGQAAVTIMRWQHETPEFRYMDEQGQLTGSWPPQNHENSLAFSDLFSHKNQALPKGLVLVDSARGSSLFWYVSISSNALPEIDYAL